MNRRDRIKAKILARVRIDPETGCWIWTGPTSGGPDRPTGYGYGRFSCDGGTMSTHIAMWVCDHGPIPPRKQLDHACHPRPNRLCCNPDHLKLVTHKRNCRLRDERNRTEVRA